MSNRQFAGGQVCHSHHWRSVIAAQPMRCSCRGDQSVCGASIQAHTHSSQVINLDPCMRWRLRRAEAKRIGGLIISPGPLDAAAPRPCPRPDGPWRISGRYGFVKWAGWLFRNMLRQAAPYVAKGLKGASAGELPVGPPTTFEFVINLRVAKKVIGLTRAP